MLSVMESYYILVEGMFVMRFENREEYRNIQIIELDFSTRTYNCLMRAGLSTLYLLIENYDNLPEIRNMGAKSIAEIADFLCALEENGLEASISEMKEIHNPAPDVASRPELPETILERPATDLYVPIRVCNAFKREGIENIRQIVAMSASDLQKMRNLGALSISQLQEQIELLYERGEEYFQLAGEEKNTSEDSSESVDGTYDYWTSGKGFDFPVIDILTERFSFKPSWMTDWFGLSRQSIYNALEKRSSRRRGIWTGKELTDSEREILEELIESRSFDYNDKELTCSCMNDRQGDLACVFVYENEIKVFFLKDLPVDLQQKIIDVGYHKFSERELAGESDGDIIYCIRKPFFLPKYPEKFRSNAQLRGMAINDYSLFISGYPIGDARAVNDDQVIAFFEDNLINGKVYISSDPKNQWIRSLASRNGYAIKDFIELYGYESKLDGTELTTEGARERHIEELKQYVIHDNIVYFPTYSRISKVLTTYCYNKGLKLNDYIKSLGFERTTKRPEAETDILEKDMQVWQSDGKFEEKVFARYPLIGSKILKHATAEKLNEISKKYIDTVLREPLAKLSLRAEMQITLALINNAKNWKNEENSNFWNYISLQFGYRDTSGAVVRLLQNCLENAMKRNRRLFIEDANGRAFKSTAVIHALSTRKSWMALFDFLFDFYKNNLNWEIIPEEPLLAVMIHALQQKLGEDNSEDIELTISYKVYSFQEGIRKLILLRPVYTRSLFERLLTKIDAMVNSVEMPVTTYEEQLCEDWFKEKITSIANTKKTERQEQTGQWDVAIDYSRIRAKLVLKNETDIQLVLPDIRLKEEDIKQATLTVYYSGSMVHQQKLSWYGNELGKTLNGIAISLPGFPANLSEMNIQVRISCDGEVIYDSEESLCHKYIAFNGNTEIGISQIKKGNYTFVISAATVLKAENAEITDIDDFKVTGLRAVFLELKDGYVITIDGKLVSFDSIGGTDIRVIPPVECGKLPSVSTDEEEYYFAYYESSCNIILGNSDFLQQFVVLKNGERIDFSDLDEVENGNGLAFSCHLESIDGTCRIQIINLADERLAFDRSFILIHNANCNFNREFYFSIADYKEATYRITIDDFSETVAFNREDDEVRVPYRNGELHTAVPRIEIEETTGSWMNGSSSAWYIGEIPQNSLLKVKNPSNTEISFLVGGKDIMYDGQGLVTLGNVLQTLSGTSGSSMIDVIMAVKGAGQSERYHLARVCFREQFMRTPEFWTEGNRLFWNQGGSFIGKAGRSFLLTLFGEKEETIEFKLDENTESVEFPEEMPIGNYRYEISITSGSLFKRVKEVIAEGDCIVGDQNRLRFLNRRIIIDTITDEFNEEAGHIVIRTCYIDNIEFQGIEDTSEGYCPVYSGILYTTGYHGERYEFSYDEHTNKRGVTKMMVNPVRIVYVGENSLCITDSDGDGLYYYYYYDRDLECTVYALTDHEYTKANKHKYSNADLYSYRTERI